MIATGEFDVFHISTNSLQGFICRTRTFRSNHIVGIAVEDTEFYLFGSFQAGRIHRSADRNCGCEYLRITDSHIKRTHTAHRESYYINAILINLRHCQVRIQQIFHRLKYRSEGIIQWHLTRHE